MLIPERTVDSLLAYELLAARPFGVIWSPTNTLGSYDHEFFASPGRAVIFECKGIQSRGGIRIRLGQLDDYVNGGLADLLYVLPAQPTDPRAPWDTLCSCAATCVACAPGTHPSIRRHASGAPVVTSAPWHRRLQPWFSHWAWCVSASNLKSAYPTKAADFNVATDDSALGGLSGASRLCHLLAPRPSQSAATAGGGGTAPTPPAGGRPTPGADGGEPQRPTTSPTPRPPAVDDGQAPVRGALEQNAVSLEQLQHFLESVSQGSEKRARRPGSVGLIF